MEPIAVRDRQIGGTGRAGERGSYYRAPGRDLKDQ